MPNASGARGGGQVSYMSDNARLRNCATLRGSPGALISAERGERVEHLAPSAEGIAAFPAIALPPRSVARESPSASIDAARDHPRAARPHPGPHRAALPRPRADGHGELVIRAADLVRARGTTGRGHSLSRHVAIVCRRGPCADTSRCDLSRAPTTVRGPQHPILDAAGLDGRVPGFTLRAHDSRPVGRCCGGQPRCRRDVQGVPRSLSPRARHRSSQAARVASSAGRKHRSSQAARCRGGRVRWQSSSAWLAATQSWYTLTGRVARCEALSDPRRR
jgi:hypothetical protein